MIPAAVTVDLSETRHQRSVAVGRLSFKKQAGQTRLHRLYQEGAGKIRLPQAYNGLTEAVLINTAGGITGGDRVNWQINAGAETRGVITTQACEKIYKSSGETARVATVIRVEEGASLDWLPQETILFDASNLTRTLTVHLAHNARFLALEAVMLGRAAMGEKVKVTNLHDRWRVFREGKLFHSDDIRLCGRTDLHQQNPGLLNGNSAFATLLYCGPEDEEQLESIAENLRSESENDGSGRDQNLGIGISVVNGKLAARLAGRECYDLRQVLIPLLCRLRAALGEPAALPKVWNL